MKTYNKQAFTLVELIVVITVLAILATIGFISFTGYAVIARDTTRINDINTITKSIELYNTETSSFPSVTDGTSVTFSWSTIWNQWVFWQDSIIDTRRISEIPTDPLTWDLYWYSVTQSTWEYQVWVILERDDTAYNSIIPTSYANDILASFTTTRLKWNYNWKFITYSEVVSPSTRNIWILWVPSLLLRDITYTELSDIHTNNTFVYQWQQTAPASYSWSLVSNLAWNPGVTLTTNNNPASRVEVIFQWTTAELSTWTWKLQLAENINDYYSNTAISNSDSFSEWSGLNPTANSSQAIEIINLYLSNNQWWLDGDFLGIDSSDDGSQSESITQTSPDCYDPVNINTIWQAWWNWCEGMLIVDNALLRWSASSAVWWNESFQITWPDLVSYTFWDDANNIFTGQVTDMSNLFDWLNTFNLNVWYWDTSNVLTFRLMFDDNHIFNQDISDWDTSSTTSLVWMFRNARVFDQDISDWDTSSVTELWSIFASAYEFNQPIGKWQISWLQWVSAMSYAFAEAYEFNQDISSWDTEWALSFISLFRNTTNFDQDISNWDTSTVTNMNRVFDWSAFSYDISWWCVSLIPSEPLNFGTWFPKPIWWTCP